MDSKATKGPKALASKVTKAIRVSDSKGTKDSKATKAFRGTKDSKASKALVSKGIKAGRVVSGRQHILD